MAHNLHAAAAVASCLHVALAPSLPALTRHTNYGNAAARRRVIVAATTAATAAAVVAGNEPLASSVNWVKTNWRVSGRVCLTGN